MNQELHNAANDYCLKYQQSHGFDTDDIDIYDSFVSGAEWRKQRLIDKAFDWLIERYENQGVVLLDDIYELKQVMEK